MSEFDEALRAMAISHVSSLEARHGVLPWALIEPGFEFRGENVKLAGRAVGIFKPRQLSDAALSIRTTLPREGRRRWYDDQLKSGSNVFEYAYQERFEHYNESLRAAMSLGLPIIYFYAIDEAIYRPILVRVAGDDPARRIFLVQPISQEEAAATPVLRTAARIVRGYSMAEVKRRLHYDKFRAAVLAAYTSRCAVCRLPLGPLLDAAYIVEDRDVVGEPRVPNGLALCKLHHGAFDTYMLGITPDCEVRLRDDVLDAQDGPVLEHGLRAFHTKRLMLPTDHEDAPDREMLEIRWKRFAA